MIKKKYTKWKPLGNYSHAGVDYIVFVKRNLKNSMLKFKTRRVNGFFASAMSVNSILPMNLIDVQKAWNEIIDNN